MLILHNTLSLNSFSFDGFLRMNKRPDLLIRKILNFIISNISDLSQIVQSQVAFSYLTIPTENNIIRHIYKLGIIINSMKDKVVK